MKALKLLLKLIILSLVAVAAIAGMTPSHYRVEGVRTIPAPPDKVWPHVASLRNWEQWSPWRFKDSTVVNTYEGPPNGPGAVMKWTSQKSGSGSITVSDEFQNVHVRYVLHFIDWNSKSDGEILLNNEGGATRVNWSMEGERSFVERVFWLLFRMDKAIAADFAFGLERLEQAVATQPSVV